MKRKGTHWFWVFMAALLLADIVVMVGQCAPKSHLNPSEVSEVYSKYVGMDGLDVTFLKDYPLSDSVAVDVTLIEATTDSAWAVLKENFNVTEPSDEYKKMIDNIKMVRFWLAPKNNPKLKADSIIIHNDLFVVSGNMRIISIFHIENTTAFSTIIDKKTNELKTNNILRL